MVLNFPKTTEFNKRVPKQKFYEHLTVSPDLRRAFVEQIKAVIWRNKLAADTLNIAAGEQVLEVEVFLVQLTGREVPEAVLRQIDKEISYHILFLLEFAGEYQAWIGYKEAAAAGGKNAFKVDRYYHTDWLAAEDCHCKLPGLIWTQSTIIWCGRLPGSGCKSNKRRRARVCRRLWSGKNSESSWKNRFLRWKRKLSEKNSLIGRWK